MCKDDLDLENFIREWYWDEKSHELAREMGGFLQGFIRRLESEGLSVQTIRKHASNTWAIGYLTSQYGYLREFSPAVFRSGPAHLFEFRHKFWDTPYMVEMYERTWRKLIKYAGQFVEDEDDEEPPPGQKA